MRKSINTMFLEQCSKSPVINNSHFNTSNNINNVVNKWTNITCFDIKYLIYVLSTKNLKYLDLNNI